MTEKKRILILADGFGAPAFTPRLRSLCDYLFAKDYELEVMVEHIGELPFPHAYPIHEARIYSGSKFDWAVKNLWSLLTDWKNRHFSKIVEQTYGKQEFDLVFCTSFHTFPLRAAIEFGKCHHIPVHIDLRDIMEQAPKCANTYLRHQEKELSLFASIFNWANRLRRNRHLRQASSVSSVSSWHIALLGQYNPNTHLIYNGFDAEKYSSKDIASDSFTLCYIGKYFGAPLQDPTLLFEALEQIQSQCPFRVEIHTSEEGQTALQALAEKYHLSNRIQIGGYISQEDAISLYRRSSILLIFSNTASDQTVHGMMTTKFFEALGMEKPALCVRSDEECLAAAIRNTHAGLAANNTDEIKSFILEKYEEWKRNGFTHQSVVNKSAFSRQSEAKQFEDLFNQLIECRK